MPPELWHGAWPYVAVAVGAAVEGEVLYSAAAVLVGLGRLDPLFVLVAGAAGAAAGDQVYFYLLRGRLAGWLNRLAPVARHGAAVVGAVRASETFLVLAIRFSPGLRIALTGACAYAGVPAWRFSLLNGVSAIAWAAGLLAAIAWLGPAVLSRLGIGRGWALIVPAVVLVVIARGVGRAARGAVGPRDA